ncbi:MAG: hypothetical protein D6696_19325 [Acidobacteria bacterium]|nr:MAG: hypothetical protein D6696_19325 [Acidobacteriota bacterium]
MRFQPQTIDLMVVAIANLANLLLVGLFLARGRGLSGLEHGLGLALIALALPLAAAAGANAAGRRPGWSVYLPLVFVLFLLAELLLDYVLAVDFRSGRLLWPYLLLYYAALMAMIGYAFAVRHSYGFLTLLTYFANQLASWWAHSR